MLFLMSLLCLYKVLYILISFEMVPPPQKNIFRFLTKKPERCVRVFIYAEKYTGSHSNDQNINM